MNTPPRKRAAPLAGGTHAGKAPSSCKPTGAISPAVRRNAPRTSREAAASIAPRAATIRERVLEHLRSCGPRGATDAELAAAFPEIAVDTLRPRRRELARAGAVVKSDRTRKNTGGRAMAVWVTTEHATTPGGEGGST